MSKRIQILEATERLLARHGFEHLSMQLVAKEAEVATGTIYRYFSDKNDLLMQLRSHVMMQCACKLFDGVQWNAPTKSVFESLWRNAWRFTLSRDANAINREQFDSLPQQTEFDQKCTERDIFEPVHEYFQKGIEQHIFKPLPTDVLSSLGIEPAICLARKQVRQIITLNPTDIEKVINACWDAITLTQNEPEQSQ